MKNLLKEPKYSNNEDAHRRIADSIVKYKEEYNWIYVDTDTGTFKRKPLGSKGNGSFLNYNDPDLDITSPELGWCNHREYTAIYFFRIPYRRQKQGLGPDNTDYLAPLEFRIEKCSSRNTNNSLLDSTIFKNMLIGDYPSYTKKILPSIQNEKDYPYFLLATSKDFCFHRIFDHCICYYHQNTIGTVDYKNKGEIKLLPTFDFSLIHRRLDSLEIPYKSQL